MALAFSEKCALVPVVLMLVLTLTYIEVYAFRVRDSSGTSSNILTKNEDLSTETNANLRSRRGGFVPVSTRGSFVRGNDNVATVRKKKDVAKFTSKSNGIDIDDDEEEDLSDLIKVEDDNLDDKVVNRPLLSELELKKQKTEAELQEQMKILHDQKQKAEQDKKRKEENERKKKLKEDEEKKLKDDEDRIRKLKEEENRRKAQREQEEEELQKKLLDEERRKREEERKKEQDEQERLRRLEDEERERKEVELKKKLEEEEQARQKKLVEEKQNKLKEEQERRRNEEEQQRRKLEEDRKRIEEENQKKIEEDRKRAEENRKKLEEDRKRAEETRKKLEEDRKRAEETRKKLEENQKRAEEEHRKKLEDERKRKEEEEIRKTVKEGEEKKRQEEELERLKKQEEQVVKELAKQEELRRRVIEEEEAHHRKLMEERKKKLTEEKKLVEKIKTEQGEQNRKEEEKQLKNIEEERRKKLSEQIKFSDGSLGTGKLERVRHADKERTMSIEEARNNVLQTKSDKLSSRRETNSNVAERKTSPLIDRSNDTLAVRSRSAINRGNVGRSMSLAELNDIILSVPTFVPNFTAVDEPSCQQHGKIFLRQLRAYKLWALQMLDSSAKITSGLLRGNINQFGDFDQCLGISTRVKIEDKTIKVQGKYCLANLDLYATHAGMKVPVNLMQSRALIRSNMRDPGHFIPKFTTVNWGICLPAACSSEDARKSIEGALDGLNMSIGIKFKVGVDPDMCYVKSKHSNYTKETIGVLYFYAIFVCLIIVATLRDYFSSSSGRGNYSERIIMAFSIKRTLRTLFINKELGSGDIGCIHGIRALSTLALYAAHKLIPIGRLPYTNRVELTEATNNPLSMILRSSLFYTDSFLLLSGVLTAYNMARDLQKRGEIRWFSRFITRFIRLTPSLLAIVFWYAFVMEHIGSGPQWNSVVKANADMCKENSWINLLYIQNFFPFEEICATHTHQLALDMQLSIIAPVLVFFLQLKPVIGIIIIFFLLQLSATLRYFASVNNNLSLIIFHGMSTKHLYKTANMTYVLPLHRATPYLFGISLGVVLNYLGKKVYLNKILVVVGWITALALGSWSIFSPYHLAKRDYVYDPEEATRYSVLAPVVSALAISWTIFACFTDNGGFINTFLSSHYMVIISRLSYALYLSQFAVFFYNVGSTRYATEFQFLKMIDVFELMTVTLVSIIITITFDIPMQEVKNIIMESTDTLGLNTESRTDSIEKNNIQSLHENNVTRTLNPEDDESHPGGWNWDRGKFTKLKTDDSLDDEDERDYEDYNYSRNVIRRPIVRSNASESWERVSDGQRLHRSDRNYRFDKLNDGSDGKLSMERYFPRSFSTSPIRENREQELHKRSVSHGRNFLGNESEISNEFIDLRSPRIMISKEEEFSRSPRVSIPKYLEQQRLGSSEYEDVPEYQDRVNGKIFQDSPRSKENDWEEEMRMRRRRFLDEKLSSQERDIPPPVPEEVEEDEWANSLRRRSSAEGRVALLKEPITAKNMELWTVSKIQLGSSQEPEDDTDDESYNSRRRSYVESEPPLQEENETDNDMQLLSKNRLEEENSSDIFKKDTKRIIVQDLSNLTRDEEEAPIESLGWSNPVKLRDHLDIKPTSSGLYKRESIIKSQASEEDPEYLKPERPKLMEQEHEHPFKKAWQLQKSKSDEEGSANFFIKEPTAPVSPVEEKREENEDQKSEPENSSAQSQIYETDVAVDVTFVWQNTKNAPNDDEQDSLSIPDNKDENSVNFDFNHRRKSESEDWEDSRKEQ